MTRIAGIEIVQAATFQRVSSGLLICGKFWVLALLLCALAPSTARSLLPATAPWPMSR
jgi:hypothetical protein